MVGKQIIKIRKIGIFKNPDQEFEEGQNQENPIRIKKVGMNDRYELNIK